MAPATPTDRPLGSTDPPVLLATLIAAKRTGDRLLERVARRELESQGIRITFTDGPTSREAAGAR